MASPRVPGHGPRWRDTSCAAFPSTTLFPPRPAEYCTGRADEPHLQQWPHAAVSMPTHHASGCDSSMTPDRRAVDKRQNTH